MGILQVQNIDLSFGDRTLLSGVSLTLGEHARAALAGGNGEGKSTLMKIIAGLMPCDGGQVTRTRGMRVSYLPQSDIVLKDNTVYEEIEKGYARFQENLDRQHEIESQLLTDHSDELLMELNELQESLVDSSYYDREQEIYAVARGLGFTSADMKRPCNEFSGGYQMRIALAKVLCESPDLMMLDEPTNYLDIEARLWLGNFLKKYSGSVFLVCHDKGFLDDTVNEVYELLEPVVVPSHLKTLHFSFPEPPHSPNDMVVIEHMTKKYGSQTVFHDFDMIVTKGQRLAVTGHNGIGKSTLLRIIAQQDPDFTGTARLGTGVKTGYYAQDTADSLDMSGTVFSQVSSYGTEGAIRNALGSFLFSGDDILKKASVLSGGERSRLALLKILLQPASLLILDEPTNHLDINSKDMLLRALQEYKGTIIFVSHDAYFIRALADRILYLSDGEPEFFNGDYDYFQWKLDQRLGIEAESPAKNLKAPKSQAERDSEFKASFDFGSKAPVMDRAEANRLRNRRNKLKSEIAALMEKVDDLEVKISEVNALMNLHENYSNAQKIGELVRQKQELEDQKNGLELEWIEKSDEFEKEFGTDSLS